MASDMFWGGAPLPEPIGLHDGTAAEADQSENSFDDDSDDSDKGKAMHLAENGKAAKRKLRIPGGIAPTFKRIKVEYDSDDARIIELKQQLYTDDYVANVLQQEGRVRYQAKTVGSRWQRLRKMLYEKENERLDEELSDWHIDEDEPLTLIVAEMDSKYVKQKANLEKKMWQEISLHLAEKLKKKKYTGKACQERFEALNNGTALMPIELDEDQQGRRIMHEERIGRAKQARLDEQSKIRAAQNAKKARQQAKKMEKEEAEEARNRVLEKRKAEQAERERIKEERRINKQQAVQYRDHTLEQLRVQREWQIQKRRKEKELCKRLRATGLGEESARPRGKADIRCDESDETEESDFNSLRSDEEEFGFEDNNVEAGDVMEDSDGDTAAYANSGRVPVSESSRRHRSARQVARSNSIPSSDIHSGSGSSKSVKEQTTNYVTMFNKAPVTRQTLLNPRSIMNNDELDALLRLRELPERTNECHAEVVARIEASDKEITGAQLDALLASHSIRLKGKKADKVRVLQNADASNSEKGQKGISSTDQDFVRSYEGYQGSFAGLEARAEHE